MTKVGKTVYLEIILYCLLKCSHETEHIHITYYITYSNIIDMISYDMILGYVHNHVKKYAIHT